MYAHEMWINFYLKNGKKNGIWCKIRIFLKLFETGKWVLKTERKERTKNKDEKNKKTYLLVFKTVCRKVHCPFAFAYKHCKYIIKLYKKKKNHG